jgi:hypothetical protein
MAASRLGIGYSTLKQWIYAGRVRTIETETGCAVALKKCGPTDWSRTLACASAITA